MLAGQVSTRPSITTTSTGSGIGCADRIGEPAQGDLPGCVYPPRHPGRLAAVPGTGAGGGSAAAALSAARDRSASWNRPMGGWPAAGLVRPGGVVLRGPGVQRVRQTGDRCEDTVHPGGELRPHRLMQPLDLRLRRRVRRGENVPDAVVGADPAGHHRARPGPEARSKDLAVVGEDLARDPVPGQRLAHRPGRGPQHHRRADNARAGNQFGVSPTYRNYRRPATGTASANCRPGTRTKVSPIYRDRTYAAA